MSFQDSAFIFFIALLLFGPIKLPELARQLGKLMGEFRRASNEFRMQLEDELRTAEQTEKQKKIAALEAAAPVAPAPTDPADPAPPLTAEDPAPPASTDSPVVAVFEEAPAPAPEPPDQTPPPIATAGSLELHPPATGLPVSRGRNNVAAAFDSLPEAPPDRSASLPNQPEQQEPAHHG